MKVSRPIELDGRTGEGGGQLVRIAVALAAVTTQPIRITHVRGNRGGPKGGGLKAQHVASIQWLAEATDALVDGLSVGSHTLEFRPRKRPDQFADRRVRIVADTPAASALLILQGVLPFLLFACGAEQEPAPLEIELCGGTNVSWSPSWEYLDQVFLPVLRDRFGVAVDGELRSRGWSAGKREQGEICLRIYPLPAGTTLRPLPPAPLLPQHRGGDVPRVDAIDVSVLAPLRLHEALQNTLLRFLADLFPDADARLCTVENSGADSRLYVLLVARSGALRWGQDVLSSAASKSKKKKGADKGTDVQVSEAVSKKVCRDLYREVARGCAVDAFLEDQLVVFQALAEGQTSFPRGEGSVSTTMENLERGMADLEMEPRKDRTDKPFGQGSLHTTTARWVAAQLLPGAEWYNKGSMCKGAGIRCRRQPS